MTTITWAGARWRSNTARLSPIDASFLRLESPAAHMHVGWSALLEPDPARERPSLEALRAHVAARLPRAPRARQRLAFPPWTLAEPRWVDDPAFEVAAHVHAAVDARRAITRQQFSTIADAFLSRPLPRSRPLWEVLLVPRLADGRTGLVGKMHHAMVDGLAAVELALLLFDLEGAVDGPDEWAAAEPPGSAQLAAEAVVDAMGLPLRAVRGAARALARPRVTASSARRAAFAVREDVLPAAPPCGLNVKIGAQRTLACHRTELALAQHARSAAGVTLNDVCLAAVAGALRALAVSRGDRPVALKTMIPVSVRDGGEHAAPGNRISLTFIELPVDARTPAQRLMRVHAQTQRFKQTARPEGVAALLNAAGRLPVALRAPVARAAASARMYNLTVSNIPGPPVPVTVLGARLTECYPVVPIAEDHALAIGVFSYSEQLFFGIYADPQACPDVERLPGALDRELRALAGRSDGHARPAARPLGPLGNTASRTTA